MTQPFDQRTSYKIVIIGSGKVAGQLGPALEKSGHSVVSVYSRSRGKAESLCRHLRAAEAVHDLDFTSTIAKIFLIAVSDDAIHKVAAQLKLPERSIVLHTSGAKPIEVLSSAPAEIGVLYPLQTFSESKAIDFVQIPWLIETRTRSVFPVVEKLAKSLSKKVVHASSAQRLAIHTAAVFASNFTNHMLHIADDIVSDQGLSLELLQPLIKETFLKLEEMSPASAQTGPALRKDVSTMKLHEDFLDEEYSSLSNLYRVISESIQYKAK